MLVITYVQIIKVLKKNTNLLELIHTDIYELQGILTHEKIDMLSLLLITFVNKLMFIL
jgi:hypothetical protein